MTSNWLTEGLTLTAKHPQCVRSGYCCKRAPCPFGEGTPCVHLEGDGPGKYRCGIYDQIIGQPGAEHAPAFGTGCCSGLNEDRREILRRLEKDG